MSQNVTKNDTFPWTKKSEDACDLVAADKLTDEAIAAKVGIERRTLARWKIHPEFTAKVESIVAAYRKRILTRGIAIVENRLDRLNRDHERLEKIKDERAAEFVAEGDFIPGGSTGLIIRKPAWVKVIEHKSNKVVGFDELEDGDFTPTKQNKLEFEYAVDTPMLSEQRAIEKQAAQELGQWTEKANVEIRDTASLESLKRRLLPQAGAGGDSPTPESDTGE